MNFEEVRLGAPDEVVWGAKRAIEDRINDIRNSCGLVLDPFRTDSWSVAVDSWFVDIALKPQVALELRKRDLLDLALEHVVLDPTWAPAFYPQLRARARRNLTTAMRFAELEHVFKSLGHADSQVDISQDRLIVSGGRIFWAYESATVPSETGDFCARSERLELELMLSSFLPYSTEHQQHVLFCDRCCSRAPVIASLMETLVDLDLRIFKGRLQVLAATQNVGHDRVDELLRRQTPDLREDWVHAAELLGSRALLTANYLSDLIQIRHLVPDGTELHAWRALRTGVGHPRAVDILHNLDEDLLQAGVAATLLTRIWWDDPWVVREDEFKIPTDGDISDYGWAVPVETNPDLDSWQAALSYRPAQPCESRPFLRELIETVQMAASAVIVKGPSLPTQSSAISEDLLQNTRDMVWVNAQRLEELANRLGPSEQEIRDSLCGLLGADVLDRLAPYPRQLLIDAERIFVTGSLITHLPLMLIGNAFEMQIKKTIVPLVEDALPSDSLYDIEGLLRGTCPDQIRQRFSRQGLDPAEVGLAISRVRRAYNGYKHREVRLLREEVREIREDWYGLRIGVPGVFQAIAGCDNKSKPASMP